MAFTYSERRLVTPSGGLTDYPVLLNTTDARWKSVANGGQVAYPSSVLDVAFYTDAGLTSQVPHEIEAYDPTTGALVAHLGLSPTLGAYYMAWGDASVSASLENVAGVWDSTYTFVGHFRENAASPTVHDATGHGNAIVDQFNLGGSNPTNTNTVHVAGPIDGAFAFASSFHAARRVTMGRQPIPHGSPYVIEARIKLTSYPGSYAAIAGDGFFFEWGYLFGVLANGRLFLGNNFDFTVSLPGPALTGTTVLALNTEYAVSAVYDGNGTGWIYIGQTVDVTGTLDDTTGVGSDNCYIGGVGNSDLGSFTGVIDEVRIRAAVPLPPVPAPVADDLPAYEDPCAIKTPLIFSIIKTPTHWTDNVADAFQYFRVAYTSLRDPSTRFGGPKSPRYLTSGPIVRRASNWQDGRWQAATMPLSLADTDYELRDFLNTLPAGISNRLNGSLRGSEIAHYVTGNPHRLANGDPRILYAGRIKTDRYAPDLVYDAEAYDPIGFGYHALARETMVPQRTIEGDFPGYGLTGTDTLDIDALCAPIICGTHSDEGVTIDGHTGFGRVPQYYCGTFEGYHVGMVAGHACHEIIEVRDQDGVAVTWGTNAFGPGKTGWAGVNPSGALLYTVINGRTYTICLYPVGNALGDGFADGSVQLFTNVSGLTYNGDGTGGLVTNLHDQLRLLLVNFFLQNWETGDWLDVPTFEYAPDRTIPLIDEHSFEVVKATANLSYLSGGFKGAFVLGLNGKAQAMVDVLAQFFVQAHVSFARNEFHQYFVSMLDLDRAAFLGGRRTVRDIRDTLASLPLVAEWDEELLIHQLRAGWSFNYRTGLFEVLGEKGEGQTYLSFGAKPVAHEQYTLIQDTDTAVAVGLARLAFRKTIRRPVKWRESLCGLRNDVLDGVPMSHFNLARRGSEDRALWIQAITFNEDGSVDFEALDVDDLLAAAS